MSVLLSSLANVWIRTSCSLVLLHTLVFRALDGFLSLCLKYYFLKVCAVKYPLIWSVTTSMGNEGSIPSDTESQVSDWQSIYSIGSRAGRRSSLGSMRIPSPMEPPEPDLSHLSPEEVAQIRQVIGRAKEMKEAENKRIR